MKQKRIGGDLDGVIYDYHTPAVDRINCLYQTQYTIDDWKDYEGRCFFNNVSVYEEKEYDYNDTQNLNIYDYDGESRLLPCIFSMDIENPQKEWQNFWDKILQDRFFLYLVYPYSPNISGLVQELRNSNFFHIITRRGHSGPTDNVGNIYRTYERLRYHKIGYDKISFIEDKTAFAKELDFMIDDSYKTAVEMKKANPLLSMYLVTRPWNKDFNEKEHGIIRVDSFEEYVKDIIGG